MDGLKVTCLYRYKNAALVKIKRRKTVAVKMNDDDTLPTRVYHPVFGARDVKDANDLKNLSVDWFNSAEMADLCRTETEAQMVVHQNRDLKVADALASDGVVRNSVAAHESKLSGANEPL